MNEPVKRWITTWPYDLQSPMGSSMIDWTKVEVIPAAYHNVAIAALQAELGAVRKAADGMAELLDKEHTDDAGEADWNKCPLCEALSAYRAAMAIRDKS